MQQSSQFDKHESKSEVVEYKAAADVTNPKMRGVDENDEDEKPATKKITVEDVEGGEKKKKKKKEKKEEMEAEAEPVAQVKSEKKKKNLFIYYLLSIFLFIVFLFVGLCVGDVPHQRAGLPDQQGVREVQQAPAQC